MRIYHFVASINNTSIADKVAKLVGYATRPLQDVFEGAGSHLAKGVHLGWPPQVISTSAPCHYYGLNSFADQVNVRDSHARSNDCWKCWRLGHFQKDCKATINPQDGDRNDAALSDTNPTIG